MAETVDDADPFPVAYAIAEQAINRDPRKATIGILMGDRTLGVSTMYQTYWFDRPDELADFIQHSFSYLATDWEDEEYTYGAKSQPCAIQMAYKPGLIPQDTRASSCGPLGERIGDVRFSKGLCS